MRKCKQGKQNKIVSFQELQTNQDFNVKKKKNTSTNPNSCIFFIAIPHVSFFTIPTLLSNACNSFT